MKAVALALALFVTACGTSAPPAPSLPASAPVESCKEEPKKKGLSLKDAATFDMEKEISDCVGGCHQRAPSDTSGSRVQVKLTTWDEIQEHAEKIVKEVQGDTMPVGGGNDEAMVKLFVAWKKSGYEREVTLAKPAVKKDDDSGRPSPQSPGASASKCATRPKGS